MNLSFPNANPASHQFCSKKPSLCLTLHLLPCVIFTSTSLVSTLSTLYPTCPSQIFSVFRAWVIQTLCKGQQKFPVFRCSKLFSFHLFQECPVLLIQVTLLTDNSPSLLPTQKCTIWIIRFSH